MLSEHSPKQILLICPYTSATYISDDINTLKSEGKINIIAISDFSAPKKVRAFFAILFYLIWHRVDLIWVYIAVPPVMMMVGLLGKLFKKPILVITGGYEISYEPSLQWGAMKSPVNRLFQRIGLSRADMVLAYSRYSEKDIKRYSSPKEVKTLYFGVDSSFFTPNPRIQKEKMVVTVCAEVATYSIVQKGVTTLIEAAKSLPDVSFYVVGKWHDSAKEFIETAPHNVHFTGRISDEALRELYQRAWVYAQLSAHEGFGIANIEAMSCECVSIVTPVSALPEIVEEVGLYAPFGDVAKTIEAIQLALSQPQLGKRSRERIARHFTKEKRRDSLRDEVKALLGT